MSSARLPRSVFLSGAAAAVLSLAACGSQEPWGARGAVEGDHAPAGEDLGAAAGQLDRLRRRP
jgi:hypothetical protein